MPEKIGKYRIVERLGSGGMGTIFKAHDSVLDRLVAVKVISTEVEITDELRARFFREAQACARLSHPNIVTVYAMGDDDGQLFIVMELLEGEELKHLIAQRTPLALEDKISIMLQVCDGLHYAHQHGIVHRDIKPGNIFLLRSGQVKLLDFGIAQMADAEGGLTRAGLIMGSLRYISPEQVRGRVDHRSDIFSLGSVLYEFLSMRPPFTGEDPMRLLEQLRTEEPPALDQLDPSIPSELAAVVARAMRKDPAERFTDLEEMRSQLEEVQRGLTEAARQLSVRVRDQRGQLLQLRAALGERLGPAREDDPVPTLDERARLATLQALGRDFSARIEVLQARITRADSLAPALRRAGELLRAGQLAEAIGEFEAILGEMPEHARALDGLGQARAQVEMQRRRQRTAKLAQDVRAALDEGSLMLCREILEQVARIPPPAEAVAEIASLREAVEAAVAAREAVRHARQEAEGAREHMEQARRVAQSRAGPQYAPDLWIEAEVKATEAATALAREEYLEARQSYEAAITVYRRFEEAAREAQRREYEIAEQARSEAAQSRLHAQAEGAPRYAREQWDSAEARLTEAEEAFVRHAYVQAGQAFDGAAATYRSLEEAAREAQRNERKVAEQVRDRMVQARRAVELRAAPQYAPRLWQEAEAKSAEAEVAFGREAYGEASEAFEAAAAAYRRVEEAAREARERQAAERARARMEQLRERASMAGAPRYARELWAAAGAKCGEAHAAFVESSLSLAAGIFDECTVLYTRAEEASHEVRGAERRRAETAWACATRAQGGATAADAPRHATVLWSEAMAKCADAEAAFAGEQYATASGAFDRARALYQEAEKQAHEAGRRLREQAEQTRQAMAERRRSAAAADAASHAPSDWQEAESSAAFGEAAFAREADPEATAAIDRSAGLLEPLVLQNERALDAPTVTVEPPTLSTNAPTEEIGAPGGLAEPAVLVEATTVVDGSRAEATHAPGAPVEAMPPRLPTQRPGKRPTGVTADHVGKRAPGSSWGSRRLTMAAVGGLAVIGLGALLWLPRGPSTAPGPGPPVKPGQSGAPTSTASSPPERAADPSVPPPSPRMVDAPVTPRQALREVFEGRNPAHSVTATPVKDAVRIGRDNFGFSIMSSRAGYVYVMVARSNGSDLELLLPNAVDTNNYIEAGRPLKLPGPHWPLKAQGPPGTNEFLAIVSDGPRDFSALGPVSENVFKRFRLGGRRLDRGPSGSAAPFAGTVACVSATRCSESYGAVVFSIGAVGVEPEPRQAGRRPPAPAAPATRARHEVSPRCSSILERASLGDPLTDEERTMLTRDCR